MFDELRFAFGIIGEQGRRRAVEQIDQIDQFEFRVEDRLEGRRGERRLFARGGGGGVFIGREAFVMVSGGFLRSKFIRGHLVMVGPLLTGILLAMEIVVVVGRLLFVEILLIFVGRQRRREVSNTESNLIRRGRRTQEIDGVFSTDADGRFIVDRQELIANLKARTSESDRRCFGFTFSRPSRWASPSSSNCLMKTPDLFVARFDPKIRIPSPLRLFE